MSSERQLAANRRNATRSTGPRTHAGKSRSACNALRHGLAATQADDSPKSPEIDELSRLIAGGKLDPAARSYANDAALAQMEILTVRAIRVELLDSLVADLSLFKTNRGQSIPEKAPTDFGGRLPRPPHEKGRKNTKVRRITLQNILVLDRYEKRACAQRDRAIRQLDAIRLSGNE